MHWHLIKQSFWTLIVPGNLGRSPLAIHHTTWQGQGWRANRTAPQHAAPIEKKFHRAHVKNRSFFPLWILGQFQSGNGSITWDYQLAAHAKLPTPRRPL
jgi:hypothetical protein